MVTFSAWPQFWRQFQAATSRNRPVVALVRKQYSPEFWKSRSFVEELREASAGFPNSVTWSVAGRAALSAARELLENAQPEHGAEKIKLQRALGRVLASSLLPPGLASTFVRRLSSWFPGLAPRIRAVDWDQVRSALSSRPPAWAGGPLRP